MSQSAETPTAHHALATRLVFLATGLTMGAWGPLVPFARANLRLDEAALGSLLLCLGLGSVIAMPFSGTLAARYGPQRVILVAGAFPLLTLPIMAAAPSVPLTAVALALFGAGAGTVDVVMNIQATIVERASGRVMMSGFHGMFSVGGLVGAGAVTGLLSLGVLPLATGLLVVAAAFALAIAFRSGLLQRGGAAEGPPFVIPRGVVIVIGLLCAVLFSTEGAVADWSGIFLNAERGLALDRTGIGYVAFAAAMTLGRFTGDAIVRLVGPRRTLFGGAILSAFGLAVAIFTPHVIGGVLGFALVGAGASNSVPVLFSAAGRQGVMPPNLAIAAATTMGYAGLLAGPAVIGYVARATTLPIALGGIAVLLVVVALVGPLTVADDR